MKIDEEIKQRKFKSIYQKAHINTIFTANWLIDNTQKLLKPFGITHQQFNVLKILKGKYPNNCTANYIKEVMLDKGPDLTRLVDRLINKRYVTRSVCEVNRRKLDITINDKGLTLVKKIEPKLGSQFIKQKKITKKEAKELSRILDKMRG